MVDLFGQGDYSVRFDWGLVGARALAADVTVIVDVLSFSTSVTIAVERGIAVLPYPWNDRTTVSFAEARSAVLAVGRLEAAKSGLQLPSLSPASLLTCDPCERLVLPSPNGSMIAYEMSATSEVVVGSLRNASAVASFAARALQDGRSIGVIAAGERWDHENSLRPALEDLIGAGAIVAAIRTHTEGYRFSPEAEVAADTYEVVGRQLTDRLESCVGGRELTAKGFAADVAAAAALDSSTAVPVLRGDAFRPAT